MECIDKDTNYIINVCGVRVSFWYLQNIYCEKRVKCAKKGYPPALAYLPKWSKETDVTSTL